MAKVWGCSKAEANQICMYVSVVAPDIQLYIRLSSAISLLLILRTLAYSNPLVLQYMYEMCLLDRMDVRKRMMALMRCSPSPPEGGGPGTRAVEVRVDCVLNFNSLGLCREVLGQVVKSQVWYTTSPANYGTPKIPEPKRELERPLWLRYGRLARALSDGSIELTHGVVVVFVREYSVLHTEYCRSLLVNISEKAHKPTVSSKGSGNQREIPPTP